MAIVTKPIALDESLNTTEQTPRNVADVLAQELARIAGKQASDVNYDNTDSGLTANNVQDAIDELKSDIPTVNDGTLTIQQNGETKGTFTANQSGNSTVNIETPTTDIQTAVDEFSTYNGGLLSECKVALSPNQDLHGYDSPWVGGAGKNKLEFPYVNASSTINGVTFTVNSDGTVKANGTATANVNFVLIYKQGLDRLASGNYIMNGCPAGGATDGSTYFLGFYAPNKSAYDFGSGANISLSGNEDAGANVYIRIANGYTANNLIFKPMLRLSTESDPTFEPYSNICPISGHTQVEVDVSDGQTTQEQVTVNLGGTYYSGTLDVVSGKFVNDGEKPNLPTNFNYSSSGQYFYWYFGNAMGDILACDIFKPSTAQDVVNHTEPNIIAFQQSSGNLIVYAPDFTDASSFNSAITGYTYARKKLTPTPIQLSPTMVKALVGENHLSAPLDGQEITESKYKQMFTFDDVIAYIQSLS